MMVGVKERKIKGQERKYLGCDETMIFDCVKNGNLHFDGTSVQVQKCCLCKIEDIVGLQR